jgi:hypothetical protein
VRRVNVLFKNVERENDAGGVTQEQSTPNGIVTNSIVFNLSAMFEEFSNVISERAGMKGHGWWWWTRRTTRVVESGNKRASFSFLAASFKYGGCDGHLFCLGGREGEVVFCV